MKKLLVLLTATTLLSSCKDLSGNIQTFQSFFLKNENGQNIQIPTGGHSLNVKFKGKKKFDLEVRLPNGKQSFRFVSNQNLKKINSGDRFSISAKDSGQPVNLNGQYLTDHSRGETIYTTESCTYYTTERDCGYVNTPETCYREPDREECGLTPAGRECNTIPGKEICSGGGSRYECRDISVPHSGYQEVSYYDETSSETVQGQLIDKNNNILANFTASSSESNRNRMNESACR